MTAITTDGQQDSTAPSGPTLADPIMYVELYLRLAATAAHIVPDPAWRRRAKFYAALADSVAARTEVAA